MLLHGTVLRILIQFKTELTSHLLTGVKKCPHLRQGHPSQVLNQQVLNQQLGLLPLRIPKA